MDDIDTVLPKLDCAGCGKVIDTSHNHRAAGKDHCIECCPRCGKKD